MGDNDPAYHRVIDEIGLQAKRMPPRGYILVSLTLSLRKFKGFRVIYVRATQFIGVVQ